MNTYREKYKKIKAIQLVKSLAFTAFSREEEEAIKAIIFEKLPTELAVIKENGSKHEIEDFAFWLEPYLAPATVIELNRLTQDRQEQG